MFFHNFWKIDYNFAENQILEKYKMAAKMADML